MLAQIDRIGARTIRRALALGVAALLSSCATKEEPQLVNDGTKQRESSIPWNEQQDWESQGQFAGMADRISEHR